jgi:hypothetical protein
MKNTQTENFQVNPKIMVPKAKIADLGFVQYCFIAKLKLNNVTKFKM